jgi:phage terminase small subunit
LTYLYGSGLFFGENMSRPKKKENGLTIKQRKFLKLYLETGNVSQSALKAGYSLGQSGFENLKKPLVQYAFEMLLEKQGLTDKKLSQVLADGLEAEKVVGYLHQYKKKGKNGKVEKIQPDEIISSEFIDVPDIPTRHKYLETAYKVKGQFKDKVELSAPGGEPLVLELKIAKAPKGKDKS